MKIQWHFINGETSEVEVVEEIGVYILDSRRKEENAARRERYHCPFSRESAAFEGEDYSDGETPESLLERDEENERLYALLSQLTETQRRRILMYADGMTTREIGAAEGVSHQKICKSLAQVRKIFEKHYPDRGAKREPVSP